MTCRISKIEARIQNKSWDGINGKSAKLDGEYFLKVIEKFHSQIDFPSKMLLQAKIYSHLIEDERRAREIYEFIIKKYPSFIDAYHSYWRFLVKRGDTLTASKISK